MPDVVIAGYGPAGAAAAIAAHDTGRSVLVVEAAARGGGNARYSGGFLFDVPDDAATDQYQHRLPDVVRELGGWLAEGRLRYRQTVIDGLERAPEALMRVLSGNTTGKALVRID